MSVEVQVETRQLFGDCPSVRIRRRWSDTCVSILRVVYPTSTLVMDIAARLGRSKGSIYAKARHLGLRRHLRAKKRPDSIALNEPRVASADKVRTLLTPADNTAADNTAADNTAVVNGQVVRAGETPPPARPAVSIVYKGVIEPRPCVRTRVGGRPSVWFATVTERMMRLWLANVHHQAIADVLGPYSDSRKITGMAVQTRAHWVGLPARHGMTMIRDRDLASKIDRQAAPLPKAIRHQRQTLDLRVCPLTGTPFYAPNMNRLSKQAKKTVYYRNFSGAGDEMALAF